MERLAVGIMLVFIVASSGLSIAAEEYSYYAGNVVGCEAFEYITIKDEKGKFKTFKMVEAPIDPMDPEKKRRLSHWWMECASVKSKPIVWLAAIGDTVIHASELPEGVTIQQIEEKIREYRQKAINKLIKEGIPISEPKIMEYGWQVIAKESWTRKLSEVDKEVESYFLWNRVLVWR